MRNSKRKQTDKNTKRWIFVFISSGNGYNSNGFGPFGPTAQGVPNNMNPPPYGYNFNVQSINPGYGML